MSKLYWISRNFSLVIRVFCYGKEKNLEFQKTRKPENPKGLNPNPKVDLSYKPEPEKTRKLFGK